MAKDYGEESSAPPWRELANSRYTPSSNKNRPSSIPSESQEKIAGLLENVATKWADSSSEPDGDEEDALPVFTRTRGEGYPAVWVGGGALEKESFEGVILCTDYFCLREPLYVGNPGDEHWKQALVGLGNYDAVIHVKGPLPVEPGNDPIEVEACRVEDRQEAASPGTEGVIEIEPLEARRIFFKVLRKNPKLKEGLSSKERDGRLYVAKGKETPDTEPCEGIVEKFFDEEGYGFIEAESVREDIFFHENNTDGEAFRPKDHVRFDLAESVRGPQALNVVPA